MAVASDKDPTLILERQFFAAGYQLVIGLDEVGRGAIAGPVAVGAHVVRCDSGDFPPGLRDSKLLSEKRRASLAPAIAKWGQGAIGYASAEYIDEFGITRALGVAARSALLQLHELAVPVSAALILLDGAHDWLSPVLRQPLQVVTRVGADRQQASVAAAAVRAKVARDQVLCEAHEALPHYAWARNKGYGTAEHYRALAVNGPSHLHRRSWLKH